MLVFLLAFPLLAAAKRECPDILKGNFKFDRTLCEGKRFYSPLDGLNSLISPIFYPPMEDGKTFSISQTGCEAINQIENRNLDPDDHTRVSTFSIDRDEANNIIYSKWIRRTKTLKIEVDSPDPYEYTASHIIELTIDENGDLSYLERIRPTPLSFKRDLYRSCTFERI